jgi:rod shape-determining protein MreC
MGRRSSIFYRKPRRAWRAPDELLIFALYFFCAVLLVLSRLGHGAIEEMRHSFVALTGPVLEAASAPVAKARHAVERGRSYVALFDEMDRLKEQNEALKQWEWRAKLLERRVAHLRSLLNAVEEPGLQFASGRVIADARGPFVRSALINLGRQDGVRIGYAVINGDGLVGRTVDTAASVARVLLLNDLNSRIPVLVGPAGVRALVSGDNSAELQLGFLPDDATLYSGDEVYTSGSDGVLPRGLRVGVVTGEAGSFRVRPYAELNALDSVSVLFFDTPALSRTDPYAGSASRALSAKPGSVSDATPHPDKNTVSTPLMHAGAADAPKPSGGETQTWQ